MTMKPGNDNNAEARIKIAARRMFVEKGYAATRTRDIAREAGINLSMLNYYFRSKENLFEQVMLESFSNFIAVIRAELDDPHTSLEEKITLFANNYIDTLLEEPGLYLFLVNEMRVNPALLSRLTLGQVIRETHFMKQLTEALARNPVYAHLDPGQFIMNMYALTIFPFATNFILQSAGEERAVFHALIQERKQWIPRWMKALLEMGGEM